MDGITTRSSILIVEDDEAFQGLYEELFEDKYEVTVSSNKEDARHHLLEQKFDVALIDMRLKEDEPKNVDGLDVAELIRDLELSTAMILKSGFPTDDRAEVVKRMEVLNFVAILDKSASNQVSELLEAVAHAVEG